MRRRSKIIRMDDWDAVAKGPKLLSDNVPRCDLAQREALHRIGSLYYISQFKRSREGMYLAVYRINEPTASSPSRRGKNRLRTHRKKAREADSEVSTIFKGRVKTKE